mmetsp:Transcript_28007/g.51665  ORF Transcript_28007/g.51665 Transcript_28007/m.51665 type:complete len:225 (+) Transcript_28007:107-781(+)
MIGEDVGSGVASVVGEGVFVANILGCCICLPPPSTALSFSLSKSLRRPAKMHWLMPVQIPNPSEHIPEITGDLVGLEAGLRLGASAGVGDVVGPRVAASCYAMVDPTFQATYASTSATLLVTAIMCSSANFVEPLHKSSLGNNSTMNTSSNPHCREVFIIDTCAVEVSIDRSALCIKVVEPLTMLCSLKIPNQLRRINHEPQSHDGSVPHPSASVVYWYMRRMC